MLDRSTYKILLLGHKLCDNNRVYEPLNEGGYAVVCAANETDLENVPHTLSQFAVVLLDLKDGSISGEKFIKHLKINSPGTQVIVITERHCPREALEADARGAFWYFAMPLDREELLYLVAKACVLFELEQQNRELRHAVSSATGISFFGNSHVTAELVKQVQQIAHSDTTVLITGETGTGKSTLARYIHQQSVRAKEPFINVSCASIPRELLESELFGYEKGAFTGATNSRIGSFELAHNGTLFLDEIGDMPLELQPKILTFLQDRELRRLGSNRTFRVNTRVIAATNKDLKEQMRHKQFREDLYYRINIVNFVLPPLRERKEDIEVLVQNYLAKLNPRSAVSGGYKLSKDALTKLQSYSWPGNVRELENILERASLFCRDGIIRPEDLLIPLERETEIVLTNHAAIAPGMTLAEIESSAIASAIRRCEGDKKRAAQELGISLKTIYNKIQRYGI